MERKPTFHVTTLFAFALAGFAHADDGIVTDRPDFVESSATVGAGRVQLETSLARERDDGADADYTAWSTPSLLRIGLGEAWEARVETDGYVRLDAAGRHASGGSDVSVGLKYHVPGSGEHGPSAAWLFHVDLPTGARTLRGHGARPSLRWVGEWELPAGFAVGIMPGLIYDRGERGRFLGGIAGITLGKDLGERAHAFVEIAAPQIAHARDGGTQATFDTGLSYRTGEDAQFDVAVYVGLNDRTPDFAATVGFSRRW